MSHLGFLDTKKTEVRHRSVLQYDSSHDIAKSFVPDVSADLERVLGFVA